jgi:DNA repair exonuclease SbcCD ATPase subunit
MIKSAFLKNFQGHKRLKIEFDPGITTIVGRTDAGKSAVFRAVRWLCLNLFPSDGIRHGAKEAMVILRLSSGEKIVRKKGRVNLYKVNGKPFRSFGAKVPEKIADLLNLNEINFQRQHDSPFWLSESAPEVSRQMNRVIDLSVIDSSMAHAARFVREAKATETVTETRLVQARARVLELKGGRERVKEFKLLREKYERSESTERDRRQLGELVERIDSHNAAEKKTRAEHLGILLEKAAALRENDRKREKLGRIIINLIPALEKVARPIDFTLVEGAWKKMRRVDSEYKALSDLVGKIFAEQLDANAKEKMANALRSQMKDRCPTCGKKL